MMTLHLTELAGRCDVSADTVRYYARVGLLQPSPGNNGYRRFTPADIQRLNFIQRAKSLGYTLGEIRTMLEHSESGRSPCPLVREIIERRILENRRRLREQMRRCRRMERAVKSVSTLRDGLPNGHSICRLIKSFDLPGASTRE